MLVCSCLVIENKKQKLERCQQKHTYCEFYFHLEYQRNPGSSARIQIDSDEIIMHIADDKQSNWLAICGKVESFVREQRKI